MGALTAILSPVLVAAVIMAGCIAIAWMVIDLVREIRADDRMSIDEATGIIAKGREDVVTAAEDFKSLNARVSQLEIKERERARGLRL